MFVDPKAVFFVVGTSVSLDGVGKQRLLVVPLLTRAHFIASPLHCCSTMDYVDTDVASEFVFKNPNSKGACGCGESFNV